MFSIVYSPLKRKILQIFSKKTILMSFFSVSYEKHKKAILGVVFWRCPVF